MREYRKKFCAIEMAEDRKPKGKYKKAVEGSLRMKARQEAKEWCLMQKKSKESKKS